MLVEASIFVGPRSSEGERVISTQRVDLSFFPHDAESVGELCREPRLTAATRPPVQSDTTAEERCGILGAQRGRTSTDALAPCGVNIPQRPVKTFGAVLGTASDRQDPGTPIDGGLPPAYPISHVPTPSVQPEPHHGRNTAVEQPPRCYAPSGSRLTAPVVLAIVFGAAVGRG